MRLVLLMAACAMVPQEDERAAVDPRAHPLTTEDALFTIPDVSGRMELVGDLDGDGVRDLLVERRAPGTDAPAEGGGTDRIDAVSGRDGSFLRTLWRTESPWQRASFDAWTPWLAWSAAGDLDRDGVQDLVVGDWRVAGEVESAGLVVALSGSDGAELWRARGEQAHDALGVSVAIVGDWDGDGISEVALGAPQVAMWASDTVALPVGSLMVFRGEVPTMNVPDSLDALRHRSHGSGYVQLRSGRSGSLLCVLRGQHESEGFGRQLTTIGDLDGDGRTDLAVAYDRISRESIELWSSYSRERVGELPSTGGPMGDAGDLTGDGLPELFQCPVDERGQKVLHGARLVDIAKRADLCLLQFPDEFAWSRYTSVAALGDVDGDGVADLALGNADFNVLRHGDEGLTSADLRAMSLERALTLSSEPWVSCCPESGAVWIYSGRTRAVIAAVFGEPGRGIGVGMGLAAAPLGDVTGDGYPDLVVADRGRAYAFPGPGPAKR